MGLCASACISDRTTELETIHNEELISSVLGVRTNTDTKIEEFYSFTGQTIPSDLGVIRKAISKLNSAQKVSIRSVYKKNPEENMVLLKNEINVLSILDHPNIVKIFEVFEDENVFHIVMEDCEDYGLLDIIRERNKLKEDEAARIIKQVLQALDYLHSKEYAHLKINLDNIKLVDNQVKIVDFTRAEIIKPHNKRKISQYNGMQHFVSPEIFDGNFGTKSDSWAAGVVAYYLLHGVLPFDGNRQPEISKKIIDGRYKKRKNEISSLAFDFISNLLVVDPQQRFSVKDALNHAWLREAFLNIN
ncbi:unnamed protein product [Blepharisma stoltei]|uniref:Protein kinase domain-containing protein n=1 Tax=Blepharisma stoltei TaxID=1481888 RepID=A0AAU9J3B4_9CILI|nr:unnamed protein product [Blepharisma stoltei]